MRLSHFSIGVATILVCSVGVVLAQRSPGGDVVGSLTTLAHEVRLLRVAVEKSAQTQSQAQTLSVYLSALQNRLNQSVARTDTLRTELASVDSMFEFSRGEFETNERLLSSGLRAFSTTEQRATTVERQAQLKTTLDRLAKEQAYLRTQLSDADTATREDMARWTEMVSRLDQLTRR
jgi:hypothetical protein